MLAVRDIVHGSSVLQHQWCILLLGIAVVHVLSRVVLAVVAEARSLLQVEGLTMHVLVVDRVLTVVIRVVGVVLLVVFVSERAE